MTVGLGSRIYIRIWKRYLNHVPVHLVVCGVPKGIYIGQDGVLGEIMSRKKYKEISEQRVRGTAIALTHDIEEHMTEFGEDMTESVVQYLNMKSAELKKKEM